MNSITQYPTLPDHTSARQKARDAVIASHGTQPTRSQYKDFTQSRYPLVWRIAFAVILLLPAVASGWISALRLYKAGDDYAAHMFPTWPSWVWHSSGICTPLAAEFLVIAAAVVGRVMMRGRTQTLAGIPILVGTLVAFVGNWTIVNPATTWGWVECFFPPVCVLSVALIFELTLIPELARREANEQAFKLALTDFRAATGDPEADPAWLNEYGKALWADYVRAYSRRRTFDVKRLPRPVQQAIVRRELAADDFWFTDVTDSGSSEPVTNTAELSQNEAAESRVLQYFTEHPEALAAQSLRQVADVIGVSHMTVSRVKDQLSGNGHKGQ